MHTPNTLNRMLLPSKQNRIQKIFSDKTCVLCSKYIHNRSRYFASLSTKNTRVAKCMTKSVEKNIKKQTQKEEKKQQQ